MTFRITDITAANLTNTDAAATAATLKDKPSAVVRAQYKGFQPVLPEANRLWLLGADDHEMAVIAAILKAVGERYAFAVDSDGKRVNPGNAYKAYHRALLPDGTYQAVNTLVKYQWDSADTDIYGEAGTVYLVECDLAPRGGVDTWWAENHDRYQYHAGQPQEGEPPIDGDGYDVLRVHTARVDHHKPGDPGYDAQPDDFLLGSSIGQVLVELVTLGLWSSVRTWGERQLVKIQLADGEADCPTEVGEVTFEQARWDDDVFVLRVGREPSAHTVAASYDVDEEGQMVMVFGERHFTAEEVVEYDECVFSLNDDEGLEIIFTAAADHCLGAAACGNVEGIDPDAFLTWRIAQRAEFQGRKYEDVLDDVHAALDIIADAPTIAFALYQSADGSVRKWRLAGQEQVSCEETGTTLHETKETVSYRDLRRLDPIPELPLAACREGVCYIAGPFPAPAPARANGEGDHKFVVGGAGMNTPAGTKPIEAWLGFPDDSWSGVAAALHLKKPYGVPQRGFAGGLAFEIVERTHPGCGPYTGETFPRKGTSCLVVNRGIFQDSCGNDDAEVYFVDLGIPWDGKK